MAAVAAGAAVVGAGISIYGQLKSASDQADIDRIKEQLGNAQASEVIQRQALNDQQLQESTYRSKMQFGSSFAASGAEGTGIGSQLEIQRQADVQQSFMDREAAFQAYMLSKGASIQGQLADNSMTAGYWNAAGTVLGAAGKVAGSSAFQPAGSTSAPSTVPQMQPGW